MNVKKYLFAVSILSFFLLQTACNKNEDPSNGTSSNGVYIAGSIGNRAVLWKDGTPTFLSVPVNCSSMATDATVAGNDVYVLGLIDDSVSNYFGIVIWKNNNMSLIVRTNQYDVTDPKCLLVDNNNVHFAYTQYFGTNNRRVVVNTNGISTPLNSGIYPNAEPISLKTNQGNVYVVGQADSLWNNNSNLIYKAVYWKNGQFTDPGYTRGSFYDADFDNNGNLYFVGDMRFTTALGNLNPFSDVAILYKNGTPTPYKAFNNNYILSGCFSTFFDISSGETYAGGRIWETTSPNTQRINNLVYWKGGNIVRLTNNSYSPGQPDNVQFLDMFVKNDKVYSLVINQRDNALSYYYENTTPVYVTGVTNRNDFRMNSIFVK